MTLIYQSRKERKQDRESERVIKRELLFKGWTPGLLSGELVATNDRSGTLSRFGFRVVATSVSH